MLLRLFQLTPRKVVWRFARTYIAGETLDEAVRTIERLNGEGCRATLDVLGEDVASEPEVAACVDEYKRAVQAIARHGLDANVSVKPTAMGIKLSPELAVESVTEVLGAAARHGMSVRLDMEDSSVTESTLELYRRLRASGFENVGVVLQAYLRRTLVDVRRLAADGASVRVCKGIYVEPREIAYKDFWLIRDSFRDAVEALLRAPGARVAIATHDDWLVYQCRRLIADLEVSREHYEYQMLLGVDAQLRRLIVAEGHPMRVYVPYGSGWFPYSTRRLVENPRLAGHVIRNVLGFGPERGGRRLDPSQSR